MLHLAEVRHKDSSGKAELKLLAYQKSEYAWALLPATESTVAVDSIAVQPGTLVLVELTSLGQVQNVQPATAWVVQLVDQYLTCGITPTDLQQEEQRAEQWRQSLTLQSQELGRRALEMEARRDQIQELEENLKREKIQLQEMDTALKQERERLQQMDAALKQEQTDMQQRAASLEQEKQRLQELREALDREKNHQELRAAES